DVQGQSQRKYIISRDNAYHGSTIAATSLGGIADMKKQVDGMGNVEHIMPPYHFELSEHGESEEAFGERAAQALEDKILALGPENVAAFIGEPIMGAGGVKIPPANYWKLIEKICRKYNILLILDEVITGFGRLGHWFACDYYGIKPDLITFAKAVTNGFQQLGGVLVSDRVSKVLNSDSQEFTHGYTYSGHPAACAAALATIGVFERDNVLDYVRNEIGPYFTERLSELKDHPLVGEVRTIGMLGAIEIVKDKASKTRFPGEVNAGVIIRDCFINEGVIMRAVGQTMVAAPPLVITKSQVDELIEKARAGLDKAASKLI
ncbi:MAG: aminotransferase class III-fold pyridoxal phosphate-dependent enzyme, partial [Exilibacterium sp.]